ncbi:MAG: hypothetical protein JSS40_05685 [Proteobacteria bacterium]|nr:hypothetical protein [Pseudomonadota bacterium]
MGLKLNLGCGQNPLDGYLNVDKYGEADLNCDLEVFPWPWPDNSVSEIQLIHVLEHLGASAQTFIGVMKEMYRVCEAGAMIHIAVPHPRHDNFIGDPTHVRPVVPMTLQLFSRRSNLEWQRMKAANSPLALYHGVDFELIDTTYILEEPYVSDLRSGKLSGDDLEPLLRKYNNVASEIRFRLKVLKDSS